VSQFKLNSQVDKNKVFLIKRHDLDVRLDVEYYQPKHFELLTKLSASHYPLKTLKEISKKIVDGPFGSSVKADDYVEKGIPFLRVADITHGDGTIELDGLIYISPQKHQEISRSTVFPNDVVIAKTGATMGAASIVPETIKEANIRGDLAAVIVNDTVFANYIVNFINTKIGQDLFWRLNSGATRGRVVISNLRKYPLVIPDVKKMLEINQFVDSAKIRKNQKEQQAQDLLTGINAYLLAELGITLPQQDNSLEKRIFLVASKEVLNQRLDPYFFQEHFIQFTKELENSKYKVVSLKHISQKITSGVTPLSGGDDYTTAEEGIPFIRSGNINIDGNIDYSDLLFLKPLVHNSLMKSSKLIKGDLMIAIVGATIGQVGIYLDEKEANINQAIALVRLNIDINSQYVKEIIKSSIGQMNLNRLKRPVARANINLEEISTMKIVLPPIDKQNQIAAHIENIRSQAKQLQTEAAQILADAKAEVERMILGE
jgi:restriction endonuclease S subunit